MDTLRNILRGLLRDIPSLPESKMRHNLLASRLKGLDAHEIATLFDMLYNTATNSFEARSLQGILVDPDALVEILGPRLFKQIYLASLELRLKKISRLFTDLPPQKTGIHGYDKEEEAKMEFITLGERRSMAKANVKDTLDRLLSDPDPMVIGNLLNNPRLTELEVMKIASKRPNSPKILKLLATHRKWSKRYRVMKAIIQNPYSPPRLSTGLLEFLLAQDLKEVASNKTLHPQVRMSADELLEEHGMERKD